MAGVPPSPYTLGSNDSPGTILTHVVLKGPNYEEWARGLRTSLRAKRKLGFVDGTITQPAADSIDLEEWWTVNSMVVAWIFNTIESNLRTTISYRDLAKDLWDDIQQRFSVGNGPRIYQLKANIVECKQQNNESIMSYFGRIKKLWDDLNDYDILPACTCKGCTCNLTGELQKRQEAERVREFLMRLDVSYATVRSNLLSTEPLPNMNHVYSKLIQEEEVKNSTSTVKHDPMSFAVRAPMTSVLSSGGVSSGGARKDAQIVCTHCKRTGHEASSCFSLIGYPEWWGSRPRERAGAGRGRGRTGQQGTTGAGRGREAPVRANAAQGPVVSANLGALGDGDRAALNNLSGEEWSELVSLWNAQKANTNIRLNGKKVNEPWIIDTGASHHMTGEKGVFEELSDIDPSPVGMPNGDEASAIKIGTVVMNDKLTLNHVLYVPNLKCNLLSVSQLLRDTNFSVQFTNRLCVMQDRTLRTLIGVGEQSGGLYYLRRMVHVRVNKVTGLDSAELWHRRLGHPSFRVVELLQQVSNSDEISRLAEKPCDVCFKAKQTREVFPLSDNKASETFELIHCDVWGPYTQVGSCASQYFLTVVDDFS